MAGLKVSTVTSDLNSIVINTTSTNKLGGTINASEITKLKDVTVTNSGVTSLTGGTNLEKIIFNGNNISNLSSLYPGVSTFINLKELSLTSDNSLAGTIPVGFLENNTLIETLDLNNNSLNGEIPSLSASLKLEKAIFNNNSFTGVLSSLEGLSALKQFRVNNNRLTGPIPTLSSLSSVEWLDFRNQSFTGFTGDIPMLSANHKLIQLYLNGNDGLSGFMPALSAPGLRNVNISRSSKVAGLSGRFHDFNTTPELQTYHAFRNEMSGELPTLSACPNLITIDFNENFLSGGIPNNINNLTKLRLLNLQNNGLSGRFPDVFNLVSLKFLRFASNNRIGSSGITGDVPDLSGCPDLQILDMASNSLTGFLGSYKDWPSVDFRNIQVQNNNLTTNAVNTLLSALCATGLVGNQGIGRVANIGGTNASPTGGASNPEYIILKNIRGWNVQI